VVAAGAGFRHRLVHRKRSARSDKHLQHRFYALYRLNPNTTAGFTFWRGRTLNTALQNAIFPASVKAGQTDKYLNRLQFDIIYSF